MAQNDPSHEEHPIYRIGFGGPVGSGKTAIIEALVPTLIEQGHSVGIITNDIYTQEDANHIRRELDGILDPARIVGVETGSCPHTAVRDDPTMNLMAAAEMVERFPDIDTLLFESGGDNLTLTFSPALVETYVFLTRRKVTKCLGNGDRVSRNRIFSLSIRRILRPMSGVIWTRWSLMRKRCEVVSPCYRRMR